MGRGSSKAGGIKAKTYALFHGSPNTNIEEFDMTLAGRNTSSGEKFLFFTDSREAADDFSYEIVQNSNTRYLQARGQKGRVYEVDVTMNNPLDLTDLSQKDVKNIMKMSYGTISEDNIKLFSEVNNQLLKTNFDLNKISEYGYDGFIAKMNNKGDMEYAVISPKQVKIKK